MESPERLESPENRGPRRDPRELLERIRRDDTEFNPSDRGISASDFVPIGFYFNYAVCRRLQKYLESKGIATQLDAVKGQTAILVRKLEYDRALQIARSNSNFDPDFHSSDNHLTLRLFLAFAISSFFVTLLFTALAGNGDFLFGWFWMIVLLIFAYPRLYRVLWLKKSFQFPMKDLLISILLLSLMIASRILQLRYFF